VLERFNRSIVWLSLGVLAVSWLLSPWGDYPINDDWQYARIVKRLAETGRFVVDVDIAPSLVGQAWMTAPFVRVFGFSHTLLRLLTMTTAVVLLWIVDRILRRAGTPRSVRVLVAVLLAGNPIFLHLALSYMTEAYGYALALAGALVWLNARARQGDHTGPIVGWRDGLATATLVGSSFWIRQFCVAVFPALVGAGMLPLVLRRDWRAVVRSLPVVAAATACFSAIVLLYFVWAKLSGTYPTAFNERVVAVTRVDPRLMLLSAFELAAYLTMFLFPFLLLERWRATRWSTFAAIAAAAAAAIYAARFVQPQFAGFHHHVHFPFSANLVNDTGVGPITFTTTYWNPSAPRPRWPAGMWTAIEWLLVGGMLLWSRLPAGSSDEAHPSPIGAEIRNFGVLLAAIAFVLYVQSFQREVLDRYFFPCVLGIAIALGARAARFPTIERPWLPLAAALPLCWFSTAGVHDYFRWNDARWKAVALAEADGGRPERIDGGYEVNGWLNYDASVRRVRPDGCRGDCGCRPQAFYCTDDSYVISMELPPGRTALATLPVSWWLADGPAIILSRRE
jgi:hypothetical protein